MAVIVVAVVAVTAVVAVAMVVDVRVIVVVGLSVSHGRTGGVVLGQRREKREKGSPTYAVAGPSSRPRFVKAHTRDGYALAVRLHGHLRGQVDGFTVYGGVCVHGRVAAEATVATAAETAVAAATVAATAT